MKQRDAVTIIGGGLAGCEAAWQLAARGCPVRLVEMKPKSYSPAHHSDKLAELVCSNSLRASGIHSAVGLLKEEMRRCDSLIISSANLTQVPAGRALAVDREKFSEHITFTLSQHPLVEIVRDKVTEIPPPHSIPTIIATGPLTAAELAGSLAQLTGQERLAFYDAIAPIVSAESLDYSIIYQKSRYEDGPGDYLNCPMDKDQYLLFIQELLAAEYVPLKTFEEPKYFEGCLPIEVICARGEDTLRFGPMKPVGLRDPKSGRDPYAVVQLRKENAAGTTYNMVGFQTKLTYSEQNRIFRLIPGMAEAEFVRFGSIHRNTFVRSPELLLPTLQFRQRPDLLLAGQLSGVEGYVESAAMGLLAGIHAARMYRGYPAIPPPEGTALGALVKHLTKTDPQLFQPSNVNFGLFPPFTKKMPKKLRGEARAKEALALLDHWRQSLLS
jgi:methylenetetrahydrofolate--tRNA-(uracil-5-)-methyltransferase